MTTFPPPPAGHAWHNPDNLTPEQVSEGYRLLLKNEIHDDRKLSLEIECWLVDKIWDTSGWTGGSSDLTYRVPLATWPIPAPMEPMPDAAEALAIVRDLAEWSIKYPRSRVHSFNEKVDEQLIALEDRARALFPQTNSDTNTP